MKKLVLMVLLILLLFVSGQVLASDDGNNIFEIRGLENINKIYEAGTNPETIDFVEGLQLYTNEEILVPEKLLVDYESVDFDRIGKYNIYYYVLFLVGDNEYRVDIASIEIEIIDTIAPILEGVKPLIVKVNTKDVDYLDGIKASDNDKSSSLNIFVDSHNVDLTKIGIYPITYYVKDNTGNETIQSTFVSVVKRIHDSDLILNISKSEFNIVVNHHNPRAFYKDAIICFDGDNNISEEVQIIDDGVDYTKVGSYQVTFLIGDEYGNIISKNVPVNIIEDNDPPIFHNLGEVYELTINTTDYFRGITAYDEVCGDMTDRIEIELSKGFRFDVEGDYPVTYMVSDYNGNEAIKEVIIRVVDNLPPIINAPDTLYIRLNQPIDLTDKINVIDNIDGIIKDYILHENDVNIAKVGTYFIDISASDNKGNEALKRITVYVYDDSVDVFYEHPIFVGSISGILVSSIITAISYFNLKKKIKVY